MEAKVKALQVELEQARTVSAGGDKVAATGDDSQLPTRPPNDGESKVDAAGAADGGQTDDILVEMKVRRRRYAHTHVDTSSVHTSLVYAYSCRRTTGTTHYFFAQTTCTIQCNWY